MNKTTILGVDYADDVEAWYARGMLGDTPLIETIMENAARAGMTAVYWRVSHVGRLTYRTRVGTPQDGLRALRPSLTPFGLILKRCDPLEEAVRAAHARGLELYVYHTLFDDCYLESESDFGRTHPEFYVSKRSKEGEDFVRGVFSFGYPEVRQYFAALIDEALSYEADGVYLDCARTHAGGNPIAVHGWWPTWTHPYLAYGFNEPDVKRYREKYGDEPRPDYSETPGKKDELWNRCRGEALSLFLREVAPRIHKADKQLHVGFFPTSCNGFNPGCHCRQMLGRYRILWRDWVDEGLIDAIHLNVDHRRFGWDDWQAVSSDKYRYARERGVRVFTHCAIEQRYDEMAHAPQPLPIRKEEDPDVFFGLMRDMTQKMLRSDADGVLFYEHCGNDDRTWNALREAKKAADGPTT